MSPIGTIVVIVFVASVVGAVVQAHQDAWIVRALGMAVWACILCVPFAAVLAFMVYVAGWGQALTDMAVVIAIPLLAYRTGLIAPSKRP